MDVQLGTVLGGRYRLERKLGAGGMGSVYEATDLTLKRSVAIKLLHEAAHDEALSRFSLEARAIAALGHPHIAALFDFDGSRTPVPFLVMERIEGESLRSLLARERSLVPARAVHIIRQVLAALAAAHAAGTVHRDIKPSNVMLVRSAAVADLVKIVDFGVAKMAEGTTRQHHTAKGAVIGTLQYMSPEQASGLPTTTSVDLYASAVCLFEMIAGYNPFAVGDLPSVLAAVRGLTPPLLTQVRADVSPALAQVVARALAKSPEQRFARAEDFAAALGDAIGAQPLHAAGHPSAAPRAPVSAGFSATHASTSAPLTVGSGPPSVLGMAPGYGLSTAVSPPSGGVAPTPLQFGAAPPRRGGFLAGMLVAILLIGLGGAGVWFFQRSGHDATASGGAPASAPAPLTSAPSAPPSVVASTEIAPSAPSGAPSTSAPSDRAAPAKTTPANSAGTSCLCLPIPGQPGLQGTSALCRAAKAPTCKCGEVTVMCLVPWTRKPNATSKGDDALTCSTPNANLTGRTPGAPCTGYGNSYRLADGMPTNEKIQDTYDCNYCGTSFRAWGGKSGAACTGFSRFDGKSYKGTLDCD